MAQEAMDALMANVLIPQTHEEAADADLVIECVKEEMATKKELLNELDGFCKPETVFASNTSSLSITEMGNGLKHPVIGMHFFNPVPSMKLIEIIRGANTTQETFDFIYNLSKEIGKDPVEVAEAPGFVVNKILIPMINEAIGLVETGVASVEDIDKAMHAGRQPPHGPPGSGRLHRSGRVSGHHGHPVYRDRRPQVPSRPSAEEDGPRRPAGQQVRQGLLRLLQVRRYALRGPGPVGPGPRFFLRSF